MSFRVINCTLTSYNCALWSTLLLPLLFHSICFLNVLIQGLSRSNPWYNHVTCHHEPY
ncbi:hypothetical protein BJX99DRAFT_216801 [Aspergillus californicus]